MPCFLKKCLLCISTSKHLLTHAFTWLKTIKNATKLSKKYFFQSKYATSVLHDNFGKGKVILPRNEMRGWNYLLLFLTELCLYIFWKSLIQNRETWFWTCYVTSATNVLCMKQQTLNKDWWGIKHRKLNSGWIKDNYKTSRGLSCHVSNSSRDRRLGPRFESRSGLKYWSFKIGNNFLLFKQDPGWHVWLTIASWVTEAW